jgi:hypothetical protein
MRGANADVDMTLTRIAVGGNVRDFSFATRSDLPHGLRRGWLTVPTREPCSGGAEVTQLFIDGEPSATGLLPVGLHEVRARIESNADDLALDAVIDLEIEDKGCLRAPAVSQSIAISVPNRMVLMTDLFIEGNSALSGLRSAIGIHVGAGAWLGRFLLTGGLGFAEAVCDPDLCGKDDMGNARSRGAFSLAANADYLVGSARINRLFNFLTVGARYSYLPATIPAPEGDRHFDVHSFNAVLTWSYGDTMAHGPFQRQERGPVAQLAIPIGLVYAPGAPKEHTGFGIGLSVRILLPI